MTFYRPRRPFMENRDELAPINWRRGFFRIWLVLSAAWIMGWIIYLILYWVREGFKSPADFINVPVVFFGPPIAVLLLGLAAAWAFRGFKPEDEEPPAG